MKKKITKKGRPKKVDTRDIDSLIKETIENVRLDRAQAETALLPLLQYLQGQVERNEKMGMVAAKYLETLQRSNEQLVKITEIARKRQSGGSAELSEDDKEAIFNELDQQEG